MTYRELMRYLERRLGYHQVPLNPAASGMKDLFESSPVHPELMTELARAIYTANRCRRLDDRVERLATLEALGPIRLKRLRAVSTDVDTHGLLEALCEVLSDAFGEETEPTPPRPALAPPCAEIIPLEPYRRRRRLKYRA